MIITYNWLQEYVDFSLSPVELAHTLTMLGLEVERMETIGAELDAVVVALVESREQHPNADKLSVCKINNGTEVLDVVCGANNFKAGDKVALAQVGATLPGDFKIKRSKIRGEESCGMLCSEKELGLADESAGIIILPASLTVGQPVFAELGLKDTVFEIGLTPNRADCLSIIGIAREVAAKLGTTLRLPQVAVPESAQSINAVASVTIEDPDLCPRYTARYISGCTIAPSPAWLVQRLNAVGMRSINNVVDITNYVLLEFGHPLHAFDFDLLAGGKIIVKRAKEGEAFVSLDGQERRLQHADLTICDGAKGVAIAGVMGGGNSEISATTVNILLESAYFNPYAIRRTSKRLGLHTESSHRFERGADVNVVIAALDRAAALIADLAAGQVAQGIIDVYPTAVTPQPITVRLSTVNKVLGTALTLAAIKDVFQRLTFVVAEQGADALVVTVPTFRVDIAREIDLIEEVARLVGYENIQTTLPKAEVSAEPVPRQQIMERTLRNLMVAQGFNEVINFSFFHPASPEKLLISGDDYRSQSIKVLNPLVEEQSVMRTTLVPSLLETAARNLNHRQVNQRIFELRRLYLPKDGEELPHEPLWLGGVLTGLRNSESWCEGNESVDFYDAKGIVEELLANFHVQNLSYACSDLEPYYHPGKACTIFAKKQRLGSFGEIHPDVQRNFALSQSVYYLELSVEALLKVAVDKLQIVPPSRFPDVTRDVALLLNDAVSYQEVLATARGLGVRDLADVDIFDLYQGEHLPTGHKSLAIRLRYHSHERTLTDEEVGKMHQKVVNALIAKLGATIR